MKTDVAISVCSRPSSALELAMSISPFNILKGLAFYSLEYGIASPPHEQCLPEPIVSMRTLCKDITIWSVYVYFVLLVGTFKR